MGNAFATHPKFRWEAMKAYKKALEFQPGSRHTVRDIADFITQQEVMFWQRQIQGCDRIGS